MTEVFDHRAIVRHYVRTDGRTNRLASIPDISIRFPSKGCPATSAFFPLKEKFRPEKELELRKDEVKAIIQRKFTFFSVKFSAERTFMSAFTNV